MLEPRLRPSRSPSQAQFHENATKVLRLALRRVFLHQKDQVPSVCRVPRFALPFSAVKAGEEQAISARSLRSCKWNLEIEIFLVDFAAIKRFRMAGASSSR